MEPRIQDDFNTPEPKPSVIKSLVNTVLTTVSSLGTTLVSLLSGLLAAVLILYSGYVLYDTFYTEQSARSSWDLLQYKPVILQDGAVPKDAQGENYLAKINSDYRAWLTVYETNIDYPVMQGSGDHANDLYYANHDIYGEVSLTGAIYLAAGNSPDVSDSYNLIYGHHMANHAMFGGLDLYGVKDPVTEEITAVDSTYFNAHREGVLVSKSAVYDLNAFALAKTDAYQNRIYAVGNRMSDVVTFLRANQASSDPTGADWTDDTVTLYFDESALDGATKIVALSTCASATTSGRLVLFCTATRRDLITIEVQGDTYEYDGQPHTLKDLDGNGTYYITNYPGDSEHPTTVEFSIDGVTWTDVPPTVTNVSDSTEVLVRVDNDLYGRSVTSIWLTVTPKPVTVTPDDGQQKIYGQGDPTFHATVDGLVGNDSVTYTVSRPGVNVDENVNTYPDAIVADGEANQGNYTVTFGTADFTIVPSDTLKLTVPDDQVYVYDNADHSVIAEVNVTEGTTIQYSIDNGTTWTDTPPALHDVDEQEIQIRAVNPNYVTDTATVTLKVTHKPVTVKADPASKVFGADDPTFTAQVAGLIGSDTVTYTVSRPGAGTDEGARTYADAIVPAGEELQGNYRVEYIPADFTITASNQLLLNVPSNNEYEWEYDGNTHQPTVTTNVTTNTTIEYSTDNGATWTTDVPTITDVGEQEVMVRATNPDYESDTATVILRVTPKPVTVKANPASKVYGDDDPTFTAEVTGLIGSDTVTYTVSRPNANNDKNANTYPDAIVPSGAAEQGNYAVTYEPADFTIVRANNLTITVPDDLENVYDDEDHSVTPEVNVTEDTTIQYSTDGGTTWTDTPPVLHDVDEQEVVIKATNPNYEDAEVTVTLKVTPKAVTVKANDASKVYGNPDPTFTAEVTGLIGGDTVTYTVSRVGSDEGVGTYPNVIVPSGEERQGNYAVTYVRATFIINSSNALAISGPDETTWVYDGTDHAPVVTTNVPGNDTVIEYSTDGGQTWTTVPPAITDVDEQEVIIKATNPDYEDAQVTVTLKVTPKAVTVKANDASKVYGDDDPTFTAEVTGLIGSDTVTYTVSRVGTDERVNTYTDAIVPSGAAEQGNYAVTYEPADFTIVRANNLTITVPDDLENVYDDEDHSVTPEVNVTEDTTIQYSTDGGTTWTDTPPVLHDVDEQEVVIKATNPNYEDAEVTVTLKVTPKAVTVKANAASKVYGASDPTFTAQVTGLIGGDTVTYTVSRVGSDEGVGTYPDVIVPSGVAEQGNYAVTYVPADFTIVASNALAITVPDDNDYVYDGEEHSVIAQVNVPGDDTVIEYSTDGGQTWTTEPPTLTDVDEVDILIKATNPNYEDAQATATLRVTPKAVTVKANAASKVFGASDPTFTAEVTGLVGSDTIAYTVSRVGTDERVGTYTNVIVAAGAAEQGNYTVTYAPDDFTITARNELVINVPDEYDWEYDGEEHEPTVTINVPDDDTVIEYSTDGGQTWTTEPPTITDVDEQEVVIRATNPDYEPAEVTITMKVTPKAVTVKADPASKVFGASDPTFTAQVTGLIGDDTVTYTVTRPGKGTDEAVGTYTNAIVPSGAAEQGNYAVTYVPADFTISASTQIVINVPDEYDWEYDGDEHKPTPTTNVPDDDTVIEYSTDGGQTWTTEPPTLTDVDEVEVVIRATNPDYEPTEVTVTLKVTPKAATVKANPNSKIYGASDPAFTAEVTGLIGNDTVTYTVTRPGAGTDESSDTYSNAIVPSGAAEQGNYTVTYVPADFTITPANQLVIDVPDEYDWEYDGDEHKPTPTTNVPGTTIEYSTDGGETWTTEPPTLTDVDEQEVIIRATNPNYEPIEETVTIKVSPKPVTVKAKPAGKLFGASDPAFTAEVTGLIGSDTITYTVTRPGAGTDERVNTYTDAIVPSGAATQGNYTVTYVPADFTISASSQIVINVPDEYDWEYDGDEHKPTPTTNVPDDDTVIEYSTDGGQTWTTEPPTLTDVDEQEVVIRATNPDYEPTEVTVTLKITPKPVTVKAKPASKVYKANDPTFTAEVSGLIGNDTITYTVTRPGKGTDEKVKVYEDAIVPSGAATQGNYTVTYEPADFTIKPSNKLTLSVPDDCEWEYDATSHKPTVEVSVTEGTKIEYSTDGGKTWSTRVPTITDVGEEPVRIRATNPNYETDTRRITLKVTPKAVTVKAKPASKVYGTKDPAFSAEVTGLLGNDTVEYTVTRPGAGKDEKVSVYRKAIVAAGAAAQGNYTVTYEPADFTIMTSQESILNVPDKTSWVYDGTSHTAPATSDVPGTTIEYSTDGGRTWSTTPPSLSDVDEQEVMIRATNPNYEPETATVTLKVTPKHVTVKVDDGQQKVYGQDDPTFHATVKGLVGNDAITYTVSRPGAGRDEDAGTYPDAIVVTGEKQQGNYTLTFESADFTIKPSDQLMISVPVEYDWVYDSNSHQPTVTTNVPGTTIEYSTDGGKTWSTEIPTLTDVSEEDILVRGTHPNYEPVVKPVKLKVMHKPVSVRANPASKVEGAEDPAFTAEVYGLIGNDTIDYAVTRPGAGADEKAKVYKDAIVPEGEAIQGNYSVTYKPADFTITAPVGQLMLNIPDSTWTYDGQPHKITVTANIPEGTKIEYSTDGGKTWTTVPPTITDAGEIPVLVKATNPDYEPITEAYTLKVKPAVVTVRANDASTPYGQDDPEAFSVTVTGLVGDDTIDYTILRPDDTADLPVGTYPGAIKVEGEEEQGNYTVVFVDGDLEVTKAPGLTLNTEGYNGPWDGEDHPVKAETSTRNPDDNKDTVIEYSTDGGETWTTVPPSLDEPGELTVLVRATNPNYETVEQEVTLEVKRRQVSVTVNNCSKIDGTDDPVFTAKVEGLLDGDEIEYTIVREPGEDVHTYILTPVGEPIQGNYEVTYNAGILQIINNQQKPSDDTGEDTPEPMPELEEFDDEETPLAKAVRVFKPQGAKDKVWAIMNLICFIITAYIFLPLLHLDDKFGRARKMRKINQNKQLLKTLQDLDADSAREKGRLEQLVFEARKKHAEAKADAVIAEGVIQEKEFDDAVEALFYHVKSFLRRFRLGIALELILTAASLVTFLMTENLRMPMTLIDEWTPIMIVLMVAVLILDMRLIRYNGKVLADEEDAVRRELEKQRNATK